MVEKKGVKDIEENFVMDFEGFIKYIKSLDPKTPIFDW